MIDGLGPQGRGTFPELSVEDNLKAGAFVRPRGAETGGRVIASAQSISER